MHLLRENLQFMVKFIVPNRCCRIAMTLPLTSTEVNLSESSTKRHHDYHGVRTIRSRNGIHNIHSDCCQRTKCSFSAQTTRTFERHMYTRGETWPTQRYDATCLGRCCRRTPNPKTSLLTTTNTVAQTSSSNLKSFTIPSGGGYLVLGKNT